MIAFIVSDDHPTRSTDSQGALYDKNKSTLLRIPGSLTSFTIPPTVRTIAIRSMNGKLQSIHIPKSVEIIEKNACNEMNPMKNITFEEGSKLKVITAESFWYSSAQEFHIPPSVEVIEENAMKEAKIKTLIFDDINNSKLRIISNNAFLGFLGDSIQLPPSVESIQSKAFGSCLSLKSINIPVNCSDLNANAFSGSTRISTVTIDEGNEHYVSLNGTLYSKDKKNLIFAPGSLESFTIPAELEQLGAGILQSMKSLTTITVDGGRTFSSRDGVLYDYNNKTLMAVAGGVVHVSCLPTVTSISGGALAGVGVKTFIFESNETLTTTGDSSFKGSSIESIIIPRTVIDIWYYCFLDCVNLTSITFCPNSNLRSIRNEAFKNIGITEIVLPDNLRVIYIDTFRSSKIQSVAFEGGKAPELIEIQSGTFLSCTSLVSFTIPKSVTTFGDGIFQGCKKYVPSFEDDSGLTLISNYAYYQCTFTSIRIPSKVASIGVSAFASCSLLEIVDFSKCECLTSFHTECFSYCPKLTTINLPLDLESVESSAFSGCSNLITINAHPLSTKLDSYDSILYTKQYEKLLICPVGRTDARVHRKTHSMGSNAFKSCSLLKNVQFDLHSEMEILGENTFYGCSSLLSISLPDSVTTIEANCFIGCNNLTTVSFPSNSKLSSLGPSVFTGCERLQSVDFGEGTMLREIGSGAFAGCINLRSVSTPERLQSIGELAFQGTALTSLSLGDSIVSVGASAFAGCANLTSVALGSNITVIPDSLFEGCSSLSSCSIANTVTKVGNNAFRGTKLESINLGHSLSSIGEGAFLNCSHLSLVTYCGYNQIGWSNAFTSAVTIRVVYGYSYSTIANRPVQKTLTPECLPMPTNTKLFTRVVESSRSSITTFVVTLTDDFEGGK